MTLTVILVAFTACGQNQDTATPPTELELIKDANYNQEPVYEYIDNTPTTTVRFYYHSTEIDPNIYALPEAFLYNAEEIYIHDSDPWTQFMCRMFENTGVRINDMWFEDNKLYVDLHESAVAFFDNFGTTGGMRNTIIFERIPYTWVHVFYGA